MKRMILVWMLILCLMPLNVWGDSVMKDFHYDQFEELYFRTIDNYPDSCRRQSVARRSHVRYGDTERRLVSVFLELRS